MYLIPSPYSPWRKAIRQQRYALNGKWESYSMPCERRLNGEAKGSGPRLSAWTFTVELTSCDLGGAAAYQSALPCFAGCRNHSYLRSSPRGFKQRVTCTFMVCFLTVPAENELQDNIMCQERWVALHSHFYLSGLSYNFYGKLLFAKRNQLVFWWDCPQLNGAFSTIFCAPQQGNKDEWYILFHYFLVSLAHWRRQQWRGTLVSRVPGARTMPSFQAHLQCLF